MKNFSLPLGQEKIISYFTGAKKEGTLSQVYVLEGARYIGKKTLAKYLSLLVMCNENEPCLKCEKCQYTLHGTNTDIFTVSNEDKTSIGIDKVREIIKEAYIMPRVSDKKIFIIENAHLLTIGAQNALLKVMEEPPSYVMFFLLCENSQFLLQTVLSRAVKLKVMPLSNENMKKLTGCTDEFLIEYASGCAGKLFELLNDDKFGKLRKAFFEKLECFLSEKPYKMYELYDFLADKKDDKETLMEFIITFFRDVLMHKTSCDNYVKNKDKTEVIARFSDMLTERQCANICKILVNSQSKLGKSSAYAVNIHAMLIKIWEEIYG